MKFLGVLPKVHSICHADIPDGKRSIMVTHV